MAYQKKRNLKNRIQIQKHKQNQNQERQIQADNQQSRKKANIKRPNKQENSDENFLGRWSRRKQAASAAQTNNLKHETQQQKKLKKTIEQGVEKPVTAIVIADTEVQFPADVDMPAIASLTEESDYSGFLSPKVSEALRKQALRKLFHSAGFNCCDGLDDYDGDYTKFAKLGDIVTADMKHQIELQARQRLQQLAEADPAEEIANTEVVTVTSSDNNSNARKTGDITETIAASAESSDSIDDERYTERDVDKAAENAAEVKP